MQLFDYYLAYRIIKKADYMMSNNIYRLDRLSNESSVAMEFLYGVNLLIHAEHFQIRDTLKQIPQKRPYY